MILSAIGTYIIRIIPRKKNPFGTKTPNLSPGRPHKAPILLIGIRPTRKPVTKRAFVILIFLFLSTS